MQLDLFTDNRPGILLNIADEFIRARDLNQAISVYEQLLAEYPRDRNAAALLKLVEEWRCLTAEIAANPNAITLLQAAWLRIDAIHHPALRSAVLGMVIDTMSALPDPERIYGAPRFHLGRILMADGRYVEAADSFHAALSYPAIERGRFMAWRGDALTLAGDNDAALECYLAAFLDAPSTVDLPTVTSRSIQNLLSSLYAEADEETGEEEAAWLPVWGWFHGVFALPPHAAPDEHHPVPEEFETLVADGSNPLPRLWFHMLTHAERLRVMQRNNRELAPVRRLMKKTNGFMFDCYLEKIGGKDRAIR